MQGRCLFRFALCVLLIGPTAAAHAAKYGATYSATSPGTVTAGEVFALPVQVTNTGEATWVRNDCVPETKFALTYQWTGGPSPVPNGERSLIPAEMKPGSTKSWNLIAQAPASAGNYTLEIDMIEEGVAFFSTSTSQVPTLKLAVQVLPTPSQGQLLGIELWYSTTSPDTIQKVFVRRRGNCPVTLDFGNGKTASLTANDPGAFPVNWSQAGSTTIKATSPNCSGTPTRTIDVSSLLCWIPVTFPTCDIVCLCQQLGDGCASILDFGPHVDSVSIDKGVVHPGDWVSVGGEHFIAKGKKSHVEILAKDWQGKDLVIPLEFSEKGESPSGATNQKILGRVPTDLSGLKDQTVNFRVVRGDGKVSNLVPASFVAELDFQEIPMARVSVAACSDGVDCGSCNGQLFGSDCFTASPLPDTSITGDHDSGAFSPLCFLGGGEGADEYSFALQNGWTLGAVDLDVLWADDAKVVAVEGFEIGTSSATGKVRWSVEGCGNLFYLVHLITQGPRGVPM